MNGPSQKALGVKWFQLLSMLPVLIAFCYRMNVIRNEMKQVSHKNLAVKLNARCIHGSKLSILQAFRKKIISMVLCIAAF